MAAVNAAALFWVLPALAGYAQTPRSEYVGSKACFGCHTAIYKSFEATDMGRSMTAASDWTVDRLPKTATVRQPGTAHTFSVRHDDSGWHQNESEEGLFSTDYGLDYAVGSGYNGLTFLIRRGKYLFQAPLSFYSRTNAWELSPGYEKVDFGFGRKVPEECINCHAGRPSPLANSSGAYADPPFQELAIGCENCHGPGEAHIKAVKKGPGTIVNPAKLSPRLADNICINCHQAGDARVTQRGRTYLDFRPGQWLFETAVIFRQPSDVTNSRADLLEHFSAMQASRCFRESAGKLSCLSCHDPHIQPSASEAVAYFRNKCLNCHNDQSCRIPLEVRSAQTPADNCIGCHMPKRSVTQISHAALTNHRLPAREGGALPYVPETVTDGVVVVNPPEGRAPALSKLTLLRAYQQLMSKNPDYRQRYSSLLEELSKSEAQDTFVQAALGDQAFSQGRFEVAATHLTLALPEAQPAIYLELGESLAKLGRMDEAIQCLKKGVELDPFNAALQKTLILQYINQKSYADARLLMEQYVSTFPEDSFMRSMLARVSK